MNVLRHIIAPLGRKGRFLWQNQGGRHKGVLAQTQAAQALPYVTGRQTPPEDQVRLRTALDRALTDPNLAASRDALMIQGFANLSLSDYHVCWR